MIKNYITTAIRNLVRYKMYSVINILGLAVGLAAVFIIAIYLKFEFSFDRFLDDSDKITRVISVIEKNNTHLPTTSEEVAEKTVQSIPEIKSATKIYGTQTAGIEYENEPVGNFKILYADKNFFEVFSYTIFKGDMHSALETKNRIVLTARMKEKIFGKNDAINKMVQFNENDYVVAGVIEDIPGNSHLRFDALVSFSSISKSTRQANAIDYPTYLRFHESLDPEVNKKTSEFIAKELKEKFHMFDTDFSAYLQPIKEIHFSKFNNDYGITGDKRQMVIFSVVALFILIIAVFNFLNLFTAQSESRLKEVGIRKVIGGKRKQLIQQFLGESLLIALASFFIAMLLVETFLPEFFSILRVPFDFSYQAEWIVILVFLVFTMFVGVISAWYPALYVSSFNPVHIFQGNFFRGKPAGLFRRALVILQFTISIGLITSIITLYSQVEYMKNKDMGFDKENVVYFYGLSSILRNKYESVKEELKRNPKIHEVTASMVIPTSKRSPMELRLPDQEPEEAFKCEENRVQPGYLKTFGIKLLQGKDFTQPHSKEDIIVNETAVKKLGLDNPIGKEVMLWKRKCRIIGVVKDYNFRSLHRKIGPLALSHYYDLKFSFSMKTNGDFDKQTLNYIENVFQQYDPSYTPGYQFMDERVSSLYRKEERVNKLIMLAAVLGIILSVIGLYAFVALMLNKRVKEMGVRKVFGASAKRISLSFLFLISKWILISSVLGWIIAYFFSSNWLRSYPYHIDLEIWMFLGSALVVFLLSAIILIQKIFAVSRVNPVNILRYE